MRDLVKSYTGQLGPTSFHIGSKQIDSCFVTNNVDCYYAEFLPLWPIMGDHQGILIDVPEQVLYGEQKLKITRPQARRLQCNCSTIRNKYSKNSPNNLSITRLYKWYNYCARITTPSFLTKGTNYKNKSTK